MQSLSSASEIRAVRAARHRAVADTMVVSARARQNGGSAVRIAFVAGRSVGKAVVRNRAKRRLRAAARHARLPEALDLVIDARHGAVTRPFPALQADLERLSTLAAQRASGADERR